MVTCMLQTQKKYRIYISQTDYLYIVIESKPNIIYISKYNLQLMLRITQHSIIQAYANYLKPICSAAQMRPNIKLCTENNEKILISHVYLKANKVG